MVVEPVDGIARVNVAVGPMATTEKARLELVAATFVMPMPKLPEIQPNPRVTVGVGRDVPTVLISQEYSCPTVRPLAVTVPDEKVKVSGPNWVGAEPNTFAGVTVESSASITPLLPAVES